MIEIKPMDESYIQMDCLHFGAMDSTSPPRRDGLWQEAPDLPPHPWSDETIAEVAGKYKRITEGWSGDPAREFMREMIRRYGSCAMRAWDDKMIVGFLRFYPLAITQLVAKAGGEKKQPAAFGSLNLEPDPEALRVQCVMTARPYVGACAEGKCVSMAESGARKGTGLKLARGLVAWAGENGWKRIVATARADLDCFYGITGQAGKTFWEKAGFRVIETTYDEWPKDDDWKAGVERQAEAKGMSKEDAWTEFRMACELQ